MLRRLLQVPLVILAMASLAFVLVRLAPGGPFDDERAPASPAAELALRQRYHLDESIPRQYARFLTQLARGDLGPSLKYRNHDVTEILVAAFPVSASLGILAALVAFGLGLPLGMASALHGHSFARSAAAVALLVGVCVPTFILGPILILTVGLSLRWLPIALWESPAHAVLPSITLGAVYAVRVARLVDEGLERILHADFIRTARAKGVPESRILWRHALRPAALPVLSYAGPMLADLLTGSFVVENLFQIPGLGVFMVNSSLNRDYPMVVGLVILYGLILLVANAAIDAGYLLVDPRIRRTAG